MVAFCGISCCGVFLMHALCIICTLPHVFCSDSGTRFSVQGLVSHGLQANANCAMNGSYHTAVDGRMHGARDFLAIELVALKLLLCLLSCLKAEQCRPRIADCKPLQQIALTFNRSCICSRTAYTLWYMLAANFAQSPVDNIACLLSLLWRSLQVRGSTCSHHHMILALSGLLLVASKLCDEL